MRGPTGRIFLDYSPFKPLEIIRLNSSRIEGGGIAGIFLGGI